MLSGNSASSPAYAQVIAVRMTIIAAIYFILFSPNVTGQRTRHLVAGTLDPLVRLIVSDPQASSR